MQEKSREKKEQPARGLRCRICTGCGRCAGGEKPDISGPQEGDFPKKGGALAMTVLSSGGLSGYWQEKIRESCGKSDKKTEILQKENIRWLITADIGTTTAAMVLYNAAGEELDSFAAVNPQTAYGADVISRIEASSDPVIARKLQEGIVSFLQEGVRYFIGKGIRPEETGMIIVGNTAMRYFLCGYEAKELGQAPFYASHLEGCRIDAAGVKAFFLPGLSAFVGADILAGIYACEMAEQKKVTLLIDLGTNGEMVLGNADGLLACAAAAGPAFEGGATRGIWGADMVSLTARLLNEGILDETGLLADPYFEEGIRIGGVKITQSHIRQFQLAKAAVAAGIRILARAYGLSRTRQIERVVLAGGFGYYLKAEDAVTVGLLPKEFAGRTLSAGNTALAGALRYGFAPENAEKICRSVSEKIKVMNLAESAGFQEYFIEAMNLKPWEAEEDGGVI